MPTTTNFSITLPTVGGSQDTWGDTLNAAFDTVDGLLAGSSQVAPNLGTANSVNWKIDGVEVTASAADINKLDGLTASQSELNIMDGGTTVSDIDISTFDKIIVNDNGSMKQVYASKIENFIVDHVNNVGTLNAGSITNGFGSITTTDQIRGNVIKWIGSDGVLSDKNDYEITHFVDEDDMASDSESALPTQQSVKAYVDNTVSSSANETGKVLQVVTGVTTSVQSFPNGQWTESAVTVSFTPKAVGSTFLVEVFAHFGADDYGGLALKSQVDNETAVEITGSNGTGSRTSALAHISQNASQYGAQPVSFAYLDDSIVYDADSETITYTVLARPSTHSSSYTMYLNRGADSTDRDLTHYIASSTIKVTEIAG